MKSVHVELSNKGGYISMLKVCSVVDQHLTSIFEPAKATHARAFAKSAEGDMINPSPSPDQAIKSRILGSSSILARYQHRRQTRDTMVAHEYSLCMKAVLITLGC